MVLSVNVSVFEYAPVRNGSVASMCCLNVTVTGVVRHRRRPRDFENATASGDANANDPFIRRPRIGDRQRGVARGRDDVRQRRRRVVLRDARRERAERRRRRPSVSDNVAGTVPPTSPGTGVSVGPNACALCRSPGWQWCGEKNVLPGTQRNMLGFVKLGASRTFVACSYA